MSKKPQQTQRIKTLNAHDLQKIMHSMNMFYPQIVLSIPRNTSKLSRLKKNCALAILDTEPEDKIAIHYDTTTRRRITGEWTSLIMKISNGQTYRLRSLSLAVENRKTISDLLVEEFQRLTQAGNTSAKVLWEKVTSVMTDSVSKNLHVEDQVAATLNSTHIPFHLLCVSHTCEVFDRGNIKVLLEAEKKLGLQEILILSFLPSSKSVTVAALQALNKLVINDGHKSSKWQAAL